MPSKVTFTDHVVAECISGHTLCSEDGLNDEAINMIGECDDHKTAEFELFDDDPLKHEGIDVEYALSPTNKMLRGQPIDFLILMVFILVFCLFFVTVSGIRMCGRGRWKSVDRDDAEYAHLISTT